MKNIFLFILFLISFSFTSFSQNERDQKSSIRNSTLSSQNTTKTTNEILEKTQIRQDSYQRQNPKNSPVIIYNDPWSWNRWNRWGAPYYGYSYFDNWYYQDFYGRRVPARTYYFSDGRKDTIFGKPTKIRFGINYNTNNEIGGWTTIGSKNFFILDFTTKIKNDKSTFYNDPRVNFPTSSQVWQDKRLSDIESGYSIYAGFGTRLKNTSGFLALGWAEDESNFQFFDETYILSDNGKYSFKDFSKDFLTMKIGIIQDFNKLSIKGDFDPVRTTFTFGLGLNF